MTQSMFIANCTQQIQDIAYRQPDDLKVYNRKIEIGGQIELKNLSPIAVEGIVKHYSRYGMVHIGEIDRTHEFTGLCYNLDAPVALGKMQAGIEHNFEVLEATGNRRRHEAAIATHEAIQSATGSSLQALEMSVEEDKGGRTVRGPEVTHKQVASGVRVTTESDGTIDKPEKGKGRGRKR